MAPHDDHPQRRQLRAAARQRLPQPDGRARTSSSARSPAAEDSIEARMERMYELFPRLAERRSQAAGHDVAAASARWSRWRRALMPDPEDPAARRALRRPRARVRRRDLREGRRDQRGRRDDPDGRAERAPGARDVATAATSSTSGQNRFEGPGQELIADPKVAELYLGGGRRTAETPTSRSSGSRPTKNGPRRLARPGPVSMLTSSGVRAAYSVELLDSCSTVAE